MMSFPEWAISHKLQNNTRAYRLTRQAWDDGVKAGWQAALLDIWQKQVFTS